MTGAGEISVFEFDDDSRRTDHRTPYLIAKCVILAFHPGGIVTARPSRMQRAIEALEAAEGWQ
jgi:hypothetical protein